MVALLRNSSSITEKKICFRAQFGGLKTGKKRGGDNAQLSSHYSEVKGRPTWSREGVPR